MVVTGDNGWSRGIKVHQRRPMGVRGSYAGHAMAMLMVVKGCSRSLTNMKKVEGTNITILSPISRSRKNLRVLMF